MNQQYNPLASFGAESLQFGMPTFDPLGFGVGGQQGVPSLDSANSFKFGMNAPTLQMGLSGINTLGNLWGAFQANKLARDQLDFTKKITNTNLNNSVQSYNTALTDRAKARGFTEGKSDEEVQNYITTNRLSR